MERLVQPSRERGLRVFFCYVAGLVGGLAVLVKDFSCFGKGVTMLLFRAAIDHKRSVLFIATKLAHAIFPTTADQQRTVATNVQTPCLPFAGAKPQVSFSAKRRHLHRSRPSP